MHRSRTVFFTRVGWPVWSIPIATVILLGIGHTWEVMWRALMLLGMVEVFAIGLVLETRYAIESDGCLHISGPIIRKQVIVVMGIHCIQGVRDFSPAPAFSPNCLAIYHSINEVVLVSPVRQAEFLAQLKALNPNIVVNL